MYRKHTFPSLHQGTYNGGGPNGCRNVESLSELILERCPVTAMSVGRHSVHSTHLLEIRALLLLRNL